MLVLKRAHIAPRAAKALISTESRGIHTFGVCSARHGDGAGCDLSSADEKTAVVLVSEHFKRAGIDVQPEVVVGGLDGNTEGHVLGGYTYDVFIFEGKGGLYVPTIWVLYPYWTNSKALSRVEDLSPL